MLRALHRHGRLSRAEIARKLRLNRSSSGHIIAGLLGVGLVRETAAEPVGTPKRARAGRPGILLELVADAMYFVGVEVGVEHLCAVEIDLDLNVVSRRVEPFTGVGVAPEAAIRRALLLAFRGADAGRLERCEGIGVSVPGQLDRDGFLRLAPLLRWQGVDVADLVRTASPVAVPVVVENDANALAIGASYGRHRATTGVTLFLVLESGVGGGIVIDGTLFRGAHGLAGELGHMRVPAPDGRTCNLEEMIGLERVLTDYRRLAGVADASLDGFLAEVRDREPGAVAVSEVWAASLAYALAQTCRALDPDRVVLGGTLAALYPLVAARVALHVRAFQDASFPLPAIAIEAPENGGPAFGAACMLHQRFLSAAGSRPGDAVADEAALRPDAPWSAAAAPSP